MGVCYYPEHWPKELWASDLDRMKEVGISTVRVAEFAWSLFEPDEGSFCFDFFDEFLALCAKKNMRVIMGTPTATPPVWLTERYPEVLNANKAGVLARQKKLCKSRQATVKRKGANRGSARAGHRSS